MSGVPVDVKIRISRNTFRDTKGCWVWKGRIHRTGYGEISMKQGGGFTRKRAHRVSYEAYKGPIPEGLTLDHLCRERRCVNPAHLEPVTLRENIARGTHATKTRCIRGHVFNEQNTRVNAKGHRWCRACDVTRQRASKMKQGAAA